MDVIVGIGQVLERHESLAQLQVIADMVEIVDFPCLGGHDYAISLRVDHDLLRMALDHGREVIGLVNRGFPAPSKVRCCDKLAACTSSGAVNLLDRCDQFLIYQRRHRRYA